MSDYAKLLSEYVKHDYKPQIIRDPSLDARDTA